MTKLHWAIAGCAGMMVLSVAAEEGYSTASPYGTAPTSYPGPSLSPGADPGTGNEAPPGTYWWYVPERTYDQEYGYSHGMAPWQMRQGYQGYPQQPSGAGSPWSGPEEQGPLPDYPSGQYPAYQGGQSYGYPPPAGYGNYRPTPGYGDTQRPPITQVPSNAQGSYPEPLPQSVTHPQAGGGGLQPYGMPGNLPPCRDYYPGEGGYPSYSLQMPTYQGMPGEPSMDGAAQGGEPWTTMPEGLTPVAPAEPGQKGDMSISPAHPGDLPQAQAGGAKDVGVSHVILPEPIFTPVSPEAAEGENTDPPIPGESGKTE